MQDQNRVDPQRWRIDSTRAHASRVYDFLLGGEDNFEVDRVAAEHMTEPLPGGIDGARANARTNRRFLGQAVRWLAAEHGVRQFLDIGPGVPTVNQTHQVAQAVAPQARIVYVDNDPIVLAHAHTLLRGTPEGRIIFVQEDLRSPDAVLDRAREVLDLDEPIALVVVAIYHMLPDADRPLAAHATLLDALPAGSWVVLSHLTSDFMPAEMGESVSRLNDATREQFVNRSRDEVARFVEGLELVHPGIEQIDAWLRDGPAPPGPDVLPADPPDLAPDWINPLWAAVGRKPQRR